MAKKKVKRKTVSKPKPKFKSKFSKQHFLLASAIAVFAFLLYSNTLSHGYVLDDFSQIKENFVTRHGLDSIGVHFKTHARYGYGRATGELYRPITMSTFSIDWELAPDNPTWAHLVNVLLYALTGGVMFLLLVRIMAGWNPLLPLLTTLFFIAHPTHVEVVANIKSRDEILMFLLCLGAIWFLFNYLKNSKLGWLFASILTYAVALFSKENAITFLAIFPLCMYFFSKEKLGKIAGISALYLAPAILFVAVRSSVIGDFTNPGGVSTLDNFLVGSEGDFLTYTASAFVMLSRYLWALFVPHPLVSDLGFNQIPLTGWGDWRALLALIAFGGMGVYALLKLKNKNLWAFAILFFLINFSIFTNLVITIGTSFGERLLYSASPGFALALAIFLLKIFKVDLKKSSTGIFQNKVLWGVAVVILLAYSALTFNRNIDWKSSYSLYAADIDKSPNSAKLNFHYGLELVQKGLDLPAGSEQKKWYDQAKAHFKKALEIEPRYHDAYSQLGLAFYRDKNYEEAMKNYELALKYRPQFALVSSNMGIIYFERAQVEQSLAVQASQNGNMEKANDHMAEAAKQMAQAKECYEKAVQAEPSMVDALRNLGVVYAMEQNFQEAIKWFSEALKYAPDDPTINRYLGSAYRDAGQPERGKPFLEKAERLEE